MELMEPLRLESGMIYSFTLLAFLICVGLGGLDRINRTEMGLQFDAVAQNIILPVVIQSSVRSTCTLQMLAYSFSHKPQGVAPTVLVLRTNLSSTSTNPSSEGIARPFQLEGRVVRLSLESGLSHSVNGKTEG